MNMEPSVNVPALPGKRSALRRVFTTAVAAGALMLGVASAHADGDSGGTFNIEAKAGPMGAIKVEGDGKFSAKFEGDKLVLTVKQPQLHMKDKRQDHTEKNFNLKNSDVVITVDKGKLKLPENGKKTEGSAPGQLKLGSGTQPITINYTATGAEKSYSFEASFTFDHRKHTPRDEKDNKKPKHGDGSICFMDLSVGPCVKEMVTIKAKGSVAK